MMQELLHGGRQAGVAELTVGVGFDEVAAEQQVVAMAVVGGGNM